MITEAEKTYLNKLRLKIFKAWGGSDFARLYAASPAMRQIGYGAFGMWRNEISEDLYREAVADCETLIAAAKKTT